MYKKNYIKRGMHTKFTGLIIVETGRAYLNYKARILLGSKIQV